MKIKINELFISLQGEGTWTGTKCLFLRFAECDLSCSFCDTDFSIKMELKNEKCLMTLIENYCKINKEVIGETIKHIVLTGGEPMKQTTETICFQLIKLGFKKIHIETNGIHHNSILKIKDKFKEKVWFTCSPKTEKKCEADEYKLIFTDKKHIQKQIENINKTCEKTIYLQPLSKKDKTTNINEVIEFLLNSNIELRLSLQTHKLFHIR